RVHRQVQTGRRDPAPHDLGAERGHHRTVVGAQRGRGDAHLDARLGGARQDELPQPAVGGDAAPEHQPTDVVLDAGLDRLGAQNVAHRVLEGGGDVRDGDLAAHPLLVLDVAGDGALEAGEREVPAVALQVPPGGEPAREVDGGRIAVAGDAVDLGAARVGQTEQPGDLVEGLPRRVVDRAAEKRDVGGDVVHAQQLGVTATDQQGDDRLVVASVLELVDCDVGREMVDPVERLVVGQ